MEASTSAAEVLTEVLPRLVLDFLLSHHLTTML